MAYHLPFPGYCLSKLVDNKHIDKSIEVLGFYSGVARKLPPPLSSRANHALESKTKNICKYKKHGYYLHYLPDHALFHDFENTHETHARESPKHKKNTT